MRDGRGGAAGLDVYGEESEWCCEDRSDVTKQNKTLSLLVSMQNVIATSHQAFLTREAPSNSGQGKLGESLADALHPAAPEMVVVLIPLEDEFIPDIAIRTHPGLRIGAILLFEVRDRAFCR